MYDSEVGKMNKTTDIFYIFFSLLFFQKEILYTARSLLSLTLTFSKRSELQEQLLIASEDPVEKANALIVKKKRARPPTFVKKLNVGNRFQFRPKGNFNAGGGSRLQAK